jgi:hypothetical protein
MKHKPHLIPLLRTTLAGAEAQNLAESEVRALMLDILLMDNQPLGTTEAARLLNKSPVTLKRWRSQGRGPTFRKTESGRVEYTFHWLREYSESGIVL